MIIPASMLVSYLPQREAFVLVRQQASNQAWRSITSREAVVLMNRKMVEGEVGKADVLRYLRLTVPVVAAARVLDRLSTGEHTSGSTKKRQDPGAKEWVVRHDRAKCGRAAVVRSIQTGITDDARLEQLRAMFPSEFAGVSL